MRRLGEREHVDGKSGGRSKPSVKQRRSTRLERAAPAVLLEADEHARVRDEDRATSDIAGSASNAKRRVHRP